MNPAQGGASDAPIPQDSNQVAGWARIDESGNPHLSDLLSFASDNYERHTEWFLKHRDNGIKNLSVIIAAESAIAGLFFTASRAIPTLPVVLTLVFLGLILAPLIAWSAHRSCSQAFKASMENAMVMAKTAWAMGLFTNVGVAKHNFIADSCPGRDDIYLYSERWVKDTHRHKTVDLFVNAQLSKPGTTFYFARLTIWAFCLFAVALAASGIGFIAL